MFQLERMARGVGSELGLVLAGSAGDLRHGHGVRAGALARRESVQIAGLPRLARRPAWSSIPRWERSTWGTTGLWFVLLVALV